MGIKTIICMSSFLLLSGCTSMSIGPIAAGQYSYVISKERAAFSNEEDELLSSILTQANDYCVEKKRYMEVKHLNEYSGFFRNDSKTTLVFSCLSEQERHYEKLPPVVIVSPPAAVVPTKVAPVVKEPEFPMKSQLNNYAF
jgi:hypothetical protein